MVSQALAVNLALAVHRVLRDLNQVIFQVVVAVQKLTLIQVHLKIVMVLPVLTKIQLVQRVLRDLRVVHILQLIRIKLTILQALIIKKIILRPITMDQIGVPLFYSLAVVVDFTDHFISVHLLAQ